jgi:hypothetical protein
MDVQVGWGSTNWIYLSQDSDRWTAVVSAVMNLQLPENAGNFLTSSEPVSFSRRTLLHGRSKLAIQILIRGFNATDEIYKKISMEIILYYLIN